MNNLKALIDLELERQNNEICLIASENIVSPEILECQGSILTNKYAEGYPEHRYYKGCSVIDQIENLAIDYAKQVFHCNYANVQPHSGSQANQAVYLALLQPYDTILGMDLNAGGHLTHGAKVSSSGKIYHSVTYGLDENGIINYEEIKEKLNTYKPKLLIVGASAYSRQIDYARIREIVDEYNNSISSFNVEFTGFDNSGEKALMNFTASNQQYCYLMVDMAHVAGIVATGMHSNPIPYADVVTTTTHKTLRGPRGGMILCNDEEIAKKINKAVFPGIQGGPLMHVIAAKAQCLYEAMNPKFYQYQSQVLANAKSFEKVFIEQEIKMASGGTDNHLLLIDLRDYNKTGAYVEDTLEKIGIIVNRNAIWGDDKPKSETSGIRIGTPNITSRGFTEAECEILAGISSQVIKAEEISQEEMTSYKETVLQLAKNHPIY